MNRLCHVVALAILAVAWPSDLHGQSGATRQVYVVTKYQTQAAKGSTDDAAAAQLAQSITTKATGWIVKQHPCFGVMTEKIEREAVILQQRDRQVGRDSESWNLALGPAARYLVTLDVSSVAGRWGFDGQVLDRSSGKIVGSLHRDAVGLDGASKEASTFGQDLVTTAEFAACQEWWAGTVTVDMAFEKHDSSQVKAPDGSGTVTTTHQTNWSFKGHIDIPSDQSGTTISYAYTYKFTRDVKGQMTRPGCSGTSHDWGVTTDGDSFSLPIAISLKREVPPRAASPASGRISTAAAVEPPDQFRIELTSLQGMRGKRHEETHSESSVSGPNCGGSGSQSDPPKDSKGIDHIEIGLNYAVPLEKTAERVSFTVPPDEKFGIKRAFTVNLRRTWK